jgi:hypothetical protein
MGAVESGPPTIEYPERMDRRMRLGPFPSSRDALKFITYAAAGALLSPFASPWVWLPIVGVGFVVCVWRPEERALDEWAVTYLLWRFRALGEGPLVKPSDDWPVVREGLLRIGRECHVAVVRTGGSPVDYLPPQELARRFELFRELLRSSDGNLSFLATTEPIRSATIHPSVRSVVEVEAPARAGYTELVSLLCRRRLLRRVYFVLGCPEGGSEAIARLEGRVSNLLERLNALELRPVRLKDRGLVEAATRFGWRVHAVPP